MKDLEYKKIFKNKISDSDLTNYLNNIINQKKKTQNEDLFLSKIDLALQFKNFMFMRFRHGHSFTIPFFKKHLDLTTQINGAQIKGGTSQKIAKIISGVYHSDKDSIPIQFKFQHNLITQIGEIKNFNTDCLKYRIMTDENFSELNKVTTVIDLTNDENVDNLFAENYALFKTDVETDAKIDNSVILKIISDLLDQS